MLDLRPVSSINKIVLRCLSLEGSRVDNNDLTCFKGYLCCLIIAPIEASFLMQFGFEKGMQWPRRICSM